MFWKCLQIHPKSILDWFQTIPEEEKLIRPAKIEKTSKFWEFSKITKFSLKLRLWPSRALQILKFPMPTHVSGTGDGQERLGAWLVELLLEE